jgi:hypothetical protein
LQDIFVKNPIKNQNLKQVLKAFNEEYKDEEEFNERIV